MPVVFCHDVESVVLLHAVVEELARCSSEARSSLSSSSAAAAAAAVGGE